MYCLAINMNDLRNLFADIYTKYHGVRALILRFGYARKSSVFQQVIKSSKYISFKKVSKSFHVRGVKN
jgi:hypothetical protein